jgi:hypothetical protein
MKCITGAKVSWMIERNKTTNDTPTWADLVGSDGYLKSLPRCPGGGTYTIGKISEPPSCSIAEHNQH